MCTEFGCQAITIIVEGGFNTIEVITNDVRQNRPVVIIHGSGRMSNVLGTLLENWSIKEAMPTYEKSLRRIFTKNSKSFFIQRR